MPITNLNNTHLSAAEITAANDAITALETALATLTISLTPEERQQYGSINEQNKLFVNKVVDYRRNNPTLSLTDVDWAEFEKDHTSRANIENLLNRIDAVATKLKNAKTLHDYDNYQAALDDYAYTGYRASTGADGYETKYNELKQFFTRTTKKEPPKEG